MVRTKEKTPCPSGVDAPCSEACPICHGRGFVRPWTLILEFDGPLPRVVKAAPPGVEASAVLGSRGNPVMVVKINRYHLSEAVDVMADYLFEVTGLKPLLRSAW